MAQAAAAAANATMIRDAYSSADKQLSTMYKTVERIKQTGYTKFVQQLRRASWSYGWAPEILDLTTVALTPAQVLAADALADVANPDADDVKARLDRRNAYLSILNATDTYM